MLVSVAKRLCTLTHQLALSAKIHETAKFFPCSTFIHLSVCPFVCPSIISPLIAIIFFFLTFQRLYYWVGDLLAKKNPYLRQEIDLLIPFNLILFL